LGAGSIGRPDLVDGGMTRGEPGATVTGMSSSFPEFPAPQPLDGQRTWTATFESYDQRNDDIYYIVDLREGDQRVARFIAQVWPSVPGNEWDGPKFVENVRQGIAKIAATGKTNTSYIGKMV
jgi:hypothetical protein